MTYKKKIIQGQVQSFAKNYPNKAKYILSVLSIKDKKGLKRVKGKINFTVYGTQNLPKFGDIIEFRSVLKPFKNFSNPGGFDYVTYMKLRDIHGSAYANAKNILILKNKKSLSVFTRAIRKIETIRSAYFGHILSIPYKNNAPKHILISLMTGKKEVLSYELRDLFSKAGISHLLAISGLHLSIVGLIFFILFYQMFSFFPNLLIKGAAKKIAYLFALIPIAGYAIFSGFSASTQRALIMAIVLLFSFVCEKEKDIFSSLCMAGIIILLLNCAALFSISFQLSFCAVLFIIAGHSVLKLPQWVHHYKIISNLSGIMLITILAGLGTLPLSAHYFNIVSHVQLLTNIIAIPMTTFIILPLGFCAFALFSWLPGISFIIINICLKVISCLIGLAEICVQAPFSWTRICSFSWVEISIFYMTIAGIYFFLKNDQKKATIVFILTFIIFFINLIFSRDLNKSPRKLIVTILDIGQGNSTLIQTPGHKNILVDGGGFSDDSIFDTGRFIVAPFLWQNKIKHIDYVILTHPEADHLNGLIYILNNFKVDTLIKNKDIRNSKAYWLLMNACKKNNITVLEPNKGHRKIKIDPTMLLFFPSNNTQNPYNLNNNSLVFKVSYKNFSMLFTGDILKDRENHLAREYGFDLKSEFILAPHHGSNTSSTKVFLDKVQPKSVIISCGWRNRYRFPHVLVLERYKNFGLTIFRTDSDGAVIIKSNGHNHLIKTFKGG